MIEKTELIDGYQEKFEIRQEWETLFRALLHRRRLNGPDTDDISRGVFTMGELGNSLAVIVIPMSFELGRPRFVTVNLDNATNHLIGTAEAKWVGDAPYVQDSRYLGNPEIAKIITPLLLPGIALEMVIPSNLTMTHASTNVDFFLPRTFMNRH